MVKVSLVRHFRRRGVNLVAGFFKHFNAFAHIGRQSCTSDLRIVGRIISAGQILIDFQMGRAVMFVLVMRQTPGPVLLREQTGELRSMAEIGSQFFGNVFDGCEPGEEDHGIFAVCIGDQLLDRGKRVVVGSIQVEAEFFCAVSPENGV